MKIWTCGSSPRSGPEVPEGGPKTSTVSVIWANFGIFFVRSKWFPVAMGDHGRYLVISNHWPGDKNNNQWSGSIAAHHAPKNSECKNPLEKFSPRFFWDQDGILLIDYLPKDQTINAEYYLSLLVQLKDILKEKRRGKFTKGVVFLHDNAPAYWALPMSWSPHSVLRIWPRRTATCSLDWRNNWKVAIFLPTRRSLLPRRPGWMDNLLIFFFFSGLR